MIRLGNDYIYKIELGNDRIGSAHLGKNLIWGTTVIPTFTSPNPSSISVSSAASTYVITVYSYADARNVAIPTSNISFTTNTMGASVLSIQDNGNGEYQIAIKYSQNTSATSKHNCGLIIVQPSSGYRLTFTFTQDEGVPVPTYGLLDYDEDACVDCGNCYDEVIPDCPISLSVTGTHPLTTSEDCIGCGVNCSAYLNNKYCPLSLFKNN